MIERCILVIEDDDLVREVTQTCLELTEGWRVFAASSSKEGLTVADRERPDVILLDVMMPDESGQGTLRRLQANPALRAIPVLFFTAKTQRSDLDELVALGARGVIPKPFDPALLAERIRELLGWRDDGA